MSTIMRRRTAILFILLLTLALLVLGKNVYSTIPAVHAAGPNTTSLYVIHSITKQITAYTFPPPPHGGGYDDLAFLAGSTYISASNPINLTKGVNTKPAVDKISLPASGSTVKVTPILYGNAKAIDTTTGNTVTLNLLDPDSLSIDPQGDLVLVDQGDSQVVFIHNPGTPAQTVTVVPTGTQLDDTVWATTTNGHMYAVDSTMNTIYLIRTTFVVNTVYTEAPADSGVNSFVGTLNLTTGIVTPVLTGFTSPTGLIFVP